MKRFLPLLLLSLAAYPASKNYTTEESTDAGVAVVHLRDAARGALLTVAPSLGNRAIELKVHGKDLLYFPAKSAAAFRKEGAKQLNGIPFLGPWANRLAGGGFWAGDVWYPFRSGIGPLRLDPNGIAIHGMLVASAYWEVTDVGADEHSAHVTSRLPFWKYPELMANWPFAQEYEMTYRLANGVVEVMTKVTNRSAKPMPVAVGFHPYFMLGDVPRAAASAHVPARLHVETNSQLVATGTLTPVTLPDKVPLKERLFDDGFTDLQRGSDGRAVFSVESGTKKIEVVYGPKYQVAVVYAPPNQPFICFEPMAAITNGVNLAHEGKYKDLQTVAPGATWQESFWVRPSGF